jgi:heat shock protein HslJ
MRIKLFAIASLSLLLLIPGACTSPLTTTTNPTPADTLAPTGYIYIDCAGGNTPPSQQGKLALTKVIWGPYSIYVFGTADLAEGARLRAQLYKDDKAIDWWPPDYGMHLQNGKWETSVKARESDVPDELPEFGQGYSLWIWNMDNPAMTAQLSLDSPGPSMETRIPDSDGPVIAELEGSKWQLVSLNGTALLPGTTITLEFQDGKATGRSDCNYYGGGYVIKAPNLINIYELVTTQLSCGERSDKQSEAYLQYLDKAICYRVIGNRLELYDVITNKSTLIYEEFYIER